MRDSRQNDGFAVEQQAERGRARGTEARPEHAADSKAARDNECFA